MPKKLAITLEKAYISTAKIRFLTNLAVHSVCNTLSESPSWCLNINARKPPSETILNAKITVAANPVIAKASGLNNLANSKLLNSRITLPITLVTTRACIPLSLKVIFRKFREDKILFTTCNAYTPLKTKTYIQ